jgi:hypothetical protein
LEFFPFLTGIEEPIFYTKSSHFAKNFTNFFFSLGSDLRMSSDDFAIYLTPEGELYDSSSVDNLKESNDAKNIKRENKV